MSRRPIVHPLAVIALTMTFVACGGDKPGSEAASPRRDAPAAHRADTPYSPPTRTDFEPIDPKMGGLTMHATGAHAGQWTFRDVNGSIRELTGGGTTTTMLQLEAHEEPVHLKLRLSSADGDLLPGRYTIGGGERKLDATYENAGVYYTAVGKASGAVELTSITDDRAVGTFEMSLESLTDPPTSARVKGRFDMIVQR